MLSSLSDHVSRCIPVPFWPDLHCFLLVGAPLTCARVPVWLTWSNSPPRPLVTASLLSPHSHLINADYKTRISELEPVNNNAGQRLNLRDVWKVMKMRDLWSPYTWAKQPWSQHRLSCKKKWEMQRWKLPERNQKWGRELASRKWEYRQQGKCVEWAVSSGNQRRPNSIP